jgi:hypothetical protein
MTRREHSSRDDSAEGIVRERKPVAESALAQRALDVALLRPSQHRV